MDSNHSIFSEISKFSDEIYSNLGNGYKENIYVNAMCYHLRQNNYLFSSEVIVPIIYNNIQIGFTRADIVIYEPIQCVIEFKALNQSVSKKDFNQINQYLKNLKIDHGILINFGNKLEFNSILSQ